jgi:2-keto-4-pentenoate hydratase
MGRPLGGAASQPIYARCPMGSRCNRDRQAPGNPRRHLLHGKISLNDSLKKIAVDLHREHQAAVKFHPLGVGSAVKDVAEAYAVQSALLPLLFGEDTGIVGYKVGLTSARLQQMCGIASPVSGVLPAGRVYEMNTSLSLRNYHHLGLEFEIAVRLHVDLPPSHAPFDIGSVTAAVGGICAAIELIDDRCADHATVDALSLVADNVWNAGAILGAFTATWPSLTTAIGIVIRDGIELDRGCGSAVLGHPFTSLTWLANHLAQTGDGLKAGQIVLTGSLVRPCFPDSPGTYDFGIAGVGSVRTTILS